MEKLGRIVSLALALMLAGGCGAVQTTEQPTVPSAKTAPEAAVTPVEPTTTPTVPSTATPPCLPAFESARCQFVNSYLYDVECGYLIVPQDRSRNTQQQLFLRVPWPGARCDALKPVRV